MTTTWTYGSKRIEIEAGRVVSSDSVAFPVGSKADTARLRATGWRKAKAVGQYDAFGRKFGADGEIERR